MTAPDHAPSALTPGTGPTSQCRHPPAVGDAGGIHLPKGSVPGWFREGPCPGRSPACARLSHHASTRSPVRKGLPDTRYGPLPRSGQLDPPGHRAGGWHPPHIAASGPQRSRPARCGGRPRPACSPRGRTRISPGGKRALNHRIPRAPAGRNRPAPTARRSGHRDLVHLRFEN